MPKDPRIDIAHPRAVDDDRAALQTIDSAPGPVERVGILHHPKLPISLPLSEEIAGVLERRGLHVWQGSAWDEAGAAPHVRDLDLLITLGGDGTILRAARMGARHGVPILGINLGRLGFLTELTPENWEDHLDRLLSGDYWIEERMMLHIESYRDGEPQASYEALNEAVVSRGGLARVVRVEAAIDGSRLTTYIGDGVIVSTATGSTAYALAAGGPIMPPSLHNIMLIPIAPHLTLDRAIILPAGDALTLRILTDHRARLTVDGQFDRNLLDNDQVRVMASPHHSLFVRMQSKTYFYETLMERLRWRT